MDLELKAGEIHAICGENGAGKSTLIKILGGVHESGSFQGAIELDGQPVSFRSAADAQRAGISIIHQELALVPELTIAENIALGDEPSRHGLIDRYAILARATELLARFQVNLDPERRVGTLGVSQQQMVEIVRALGRQARVLVLDEPTAALTTRESVRLLRIMRTLSEQGLGLLFVSHRLDEVLAIADRITVLRDGATVASAPARTLSKPELIHHMVGRPVADHYHRTPARPGPVALAVSGLSASPPPGGTVQLLDISFTVRAGEVLGIGGLMGAGRSELLMHLMGAWGRRTAGTLMLHGEALEDHDPRQAIKRGLVLVTEDRKQLGLNLRGSVRDNLTLGALGRFTVRGLIDRVAEALALRGQIERLRIRTSDADGGAGVAGLSGGNQQKVVLAKALLSEPQVVLLDEPTRGVDVGAKAEIYGIINQLTAEGRAVILVSSDLSELIGMSDRILMLANGAIAGAFTREEATAERLMAASVNAQSAPFASAAIASPAGGSLALAGSPAGAAVPVQDPQHRKPASALDSSKETIVVPPPKPPQGTP